MPGEALSLEERVEIEVGVARRKSATSIAVRLGRQTSTVTRELERNGGRGRYKAVVADRRASEQRSRPKLTRFQADPVLAAHVEARLAAKDSPMTIAVELARGVHACYIETVSHETIYTAVHAQGRAGLAKGLHVHLHRGRRCRKHRRAAGEALAKTSPLGNFNPISSRPVAADNRGEVGHLEGDLICGAFNRSAIATVFDRASRHCWLAEFPDDHGAEATLAALVELLERIPQPLRRTLTWDQGRELALHDLLADYTAITVYFAEPHSPWQRPTNENGNGILRRYVGKGTDLSTYTAEQLRAIEHRLNTMPRRSLHWSTAHDIYNAAVVAATA